MASRSERLPLLNPDVYWVSVMDLVFYPGNHIVKSIDPLFTAVTGAKGLVFCFGQQSDDVFTLMLHPMFESSDA